MGTITYIQPRGSRVSGTLMKDLETKISEIDSKIEEIDAYTSQIQATLDSIVSDFIVTDDDINDILNMIDGV